MLWLLKFCVFGHVHRWKIINSIRLVDGGERIGTRYHLQCEKCGDVVKRQLA